MSDEKIYLPNSDENTLLFAKNIARAYGEIGQLSAAEVEQAQTADALSVVNDIIAKVPELTEEKRIEFCEHFIGDDENFNGATPAILADAYRALLARAENGEEGAEEKLKRLATRIDEMSIDFANSAGMIIDNGRNFPVVDLNNVADVYAGMADMLNARKARLDKDADADKIATIDKNLEYLNKTIGDYDAAWGLANLNEKNAARLEDRWDDVNDAVNKAQLADQTKAAAAKFKFYDKDNKIIPQYVDENGELHTDYAPGMQMVADGRMASMVEFARHDVVRKHVAKFEEKINEAALQQEVNEELLFKLYETSMADKVVQGAIDDPEQFTNPEKREALLKEITANGGEISDVGYNAAVNAHCNSTAGWAARVKAKIGRGASKVGRFFERVFKPVERVDNMKNARVTNVNANKKRVQLFVRILKGFASAFVASAFITGIATAAAAVAGVSMVASLAAIGVMTGIGLAWFQVRRWRQERAARGEPTDIKAFLADKRLLSSLGVSAIAILAMCFGAAGLAEGAMALGYGAMAIGGGKNALESYKDARASNLGRAESIAWAIANAAAVIGGGFAGRMAANSVIDTINTAWPENKSFQNETTRQEQYDTTRTEIRTEYGQDALDNAERITKMWYQDNPDLLQQRVDAINAYNAEHGTNINPYRAIMINGDAGGQTFDNMQLHVNNSHLDPNINDVYSGGNHRVMTDAWGRAHGYSHDDLLAARNLFNADGSVNSAGMDVVARLDNNVSVTNTIGHVDGRPVHTDNYFKPNDAEGWTTYTDGKSAFVQNAYEVPDVDFRTVTDYTRAMGDGMAAYGNYNKNEQTLRNRVGAFPRKPAQQPTPTPEPVDPVKPIEPVKPEPIEPEKIDWPKPVLVPHDEDKYDDFELIEDQEKTDWPKPVHVPHDEDKYDDFELIEDREPEIRRLPPHLRGYLPAGREEEQQILVTPPHETPIRGRLNHGRPELPPFDKIFGKQDEYTDLPHHETRALPTHGSPELAITFAQAKNWYNLHDRLAKVQKKRQKNPSGAKAADLKRQENDLVNQINHLRNVLGGASDAEIYAACPEAIRRGRLTEAMAELAKHEMAKPTGGYAGARMPQWEQRRAELLKRIEELGGPDSLSENWRYQAIPVKGVQAIKKAARKPVSVGDVIIDAPVDGDVEDIDFEEIESRPNEQPVKPAEQVPENGQGDDKPQNKAVEQPRVIITPAPVMPEQENAEPQFVEPKPELQPNPQPEPEPQPEPKKSGVDLALNTANGRSGSEVGNREYFTPEALTRLADNAAVLAEPLMYWHGVPVHLVDFDGRGNPIMQTHEQPVVVANIGGFLMPFYLTTGLNANIDRETGRWQPLYGLGYEGHLYTGIATKVGDKYESLRGLTQIADALDSKIGDIRNWRDNNKTKDRIAEGLRGFAGGCDAMPVMDAPRVCDELYANTYEGKQIYGLNPGGNEAFVLTGQDVLADALGGVGTPENKSAREHMDAGTKNVSERPLRRLLKRLNRGDPNRQ